MTDPLKDSLRRALASRAQITELDLTKGFPTVRNTGRSLPIVLSSVLAVAVIAGGIFTTIAIGRNSETVTNATPGVEQERLATLTGDHAAGIGRMSALVGPLKAVSDGQTVCFWIGESLGNGKALVLPAGFSALDDPLRVVDDKGQVVAGVDDASVAFSGFSSGGVVNCGGESLPAITVSSIHVDSPAPLESTGAIVSVGPETCAGRAFSGSLPSDAAGEAATPSDAIESFLKRPAIPGFKTPGSPWTPLSPTRESSREYESDNRTLNIQQLPDHTWIVLEGEIRC